MLSKLDKEKSKLFPRILQPMSNRADSEFSALYTWMDIPTLSRVEKKYSENTIFNFTVLLEEKRGENQVS